MPNPTSYDDNRGRNDDRPAPRDDRGAPPRDERQFGRGGANDPQRDMSRGPLPDDRGRNAPPPNEPREARDGAPAVPDGDYPVRVVTHAWGYSGGEKHEQIGIRLRITDGPLKGNTSLLYYGSFHPNSEEYTVKAMRALGHVGNVPSDCRGFYEPDGAAGIAVVARETYNGKTYSKVKFINGGDVVMKDAMEPGELQRFDQRMKGVFARGAAPAPKDDRRAPPPPRDNRGPQDRRPNGDPGRGPRRPDDDIPY